MEPAEQPEVREHPAHSAPHSVENEDDRHSAMGSSGEQSQGNQQHPRDSSESGDDSSEDSDSEESGSEDNESFGKEMEHDVDLNEREVSNINFET